MTRARTLADLGSQSLATDAEATAAASAAAAAVPTGGKNLLYNGAMQVAQRGTSASGLTGSIPYNTADRWAMAFSSAGTWTQTVENDAPTGSGFRKSVKMLCTTADSSLSAGDYGLFSQILEGQDLQRVGKGTSAAKQLTLSFWVKSNVTGTYIAELRDNDNSRAVSGAYVINASATWEKKTVTFAADLTGAFDNDNAASLEINFWLAGGSNFTSGTPLQTAWGTASNTRAVGQTNLAAATNNYWQITGVQLEVGDTATEFEHLPYGVELAKCQRYFQRVYSFSLYGTNFSSSGTIVNAGLPVQMRSTPSVTAEGTNRAINVPGIGVNSTHTNGQPYDTNVNNVGWYAYGGSGFTVGMPSIWRGSDLLASAEL